ncbi:uncharacterized protein LOC121762988 [Salvia splendens]|uniref:uncharacterized protein LOC121762988 n=1 Tax=Salvia splendens TaxID=180675 RepID=UPI001C271240|nr:uncharacterized protein LOC121762988 [Salvia splendens]
MMILNLAIGFGMRSPTWIGLGTKFDTKLQLKTAVTLWHLESSTKEYRVVESNPNSRDHANVSSAMVAFCIKHHILKDPEYTPNSIIDDVKQKYHVEISYKKAWYARRKAIELVFGGWESSFEDLPSYMIELQKRTRGTIVEWHHDERHSTETQKLFKYVFWAFGPCVEAFQLCKPVLTVDGTHLRGRLKGKLLCAVGFDANKKFLPVAYAIVDNETSDSWNWFMKLIKLHVMKGDRDVCIISDRHPGMLNAMESDIWEQPPRGIHRFCLVHVRKNVLQHHKGVRVKSLVWKMGITTHERKYFRRRRSLWYVSPEAVEYLRRIDAEQWTIAYDKGRRWGEATTNIVEAYNNVLKGARDLPVRACIDLTFWRIIKWFQTRSTEVAQCQTVLTPWAHDKFNDNDARGRKHVVRRVNIHEGRCEGCLVLTLRQLPEIEEIIFYALHQDYWEIPPWTLECSVGQFVPHSRGRFRKARIQNQMDENEPD